MINYQRYTRVMVSIVVGLAFYNAQANNASYLRKAEHGSNIFCTFKTIETERLLIRPFELFEDEQLFAMMSDPQVINQTIALELHQNRNQTKDLLKIIMQTYSAQRFTDWTIFAIIDKGTNALIGYCGFYAYAPFFNRAEIGYALRCEYWGKGIVPEACKALVSYGFLTCGINRIEATVYPENIGSIRVCQKLGMKQEGVLRQHVMREGRYRDRLIFSLLQEEWRTQ